MITSAVKNSPMASAATRAIVIESSMVIRRSRTFSHASWKIGQPPPIVPTKPITLTRANGSHTLNHTAMAATTTSPIRTSSIQSICSECSGSLCVFTHVWPYFK